MDKAKKRRKKMSREIRVEEGSASRIFVIVEGKEIEFRLTLVKEKSIWGEGRYDFRLVYMSENGTVGRSVYSGGATGCGINLYDMSDTDNRIPAEMVVTQDIAEIMEVARKQKEEADAEQKAEIEKKVALTEKLNSLPRETLLFEDIGEEGIKFYAKAERAYYDPTRASKVDWRVWIVVRDNKETEWQLFYFTRTYFKNGRRQVEAFRKEINNRFDTDWNWYRAEFVLDNVKKVYDAYLADAKRV